MAELVLPGVSIEVRDEGLIAPLGVTVGNLGVVGTASKGPIGVPVILGSLGEARERFGDYDAWEGGGPDKLTLVRALEQAYRHGATTVFAVRVTSTQAAGNPEDFVPAWGKHSKARRAAFDVAAETAGKVAARLAARTHGTWGDRIAVNVADAEQGAFVVSETFLGTSLTLKRKPAQSARNRVQVRTGGQTRTLSVVYAPAVPAAGSAQLDTTSVNLTFAATEIPGPTDEIIASYLVPQADSRKVTLRQGATTEVYTVADGQHLADQVKTSALVTGKAIDGAEKPKKHATADEFREFATGTPGGDGADAATTDYDLGFEQLLNEPAHLMIAAGQDSTAYGSELKAHCEKASNNDFQKERIGVIGAKLGATFDELRGHGLDSARIVFVAPGIRSSDAASGTEVVLPGSYTAAAIAGMLSALDPHLSLTNKAPSVDGLEMRFTRPQLEQLVQARALVLEDSRDRGIRVVRAITTATNTAWLQITTRRIVDYASFGVRSAASPFIGKLNNERVRSALRTAINSFLSDMLADEMLISYELAVSATRDQEIKGVVEVTMVLRPVFSIDFIKVVIFLQ